MNSALTWLLMVASAATLGCSSNDTGPSGGDGNGGGGGGGAVGSITVGNIFFQSDHDGTKNPAVDTVAAGTTVTWTWVGTGNTPHGIESLGSPSFANSAVLTGSGQKYTLQLTAPGTYQYDCQVHHSLMTGTLVVQ